MVIVVVVLVVAAAAASVLCNAAIRVFRLGWLGDTG